MPVRRSEFSYIDSHMKSLSSISSKARVSRVGFFRTALCASITVALLAAPTITNAESPHKPTARTPKPPRIDETAPPQAEAEVQPSSEAAEQVLPTSGPAISQFLVPPFTVVTPTWTALGPAPIPNGQT